ncbi:hypothetical protein DIPPA_14456 [Diplonema papillatum]|nr:hypothetical protein DIPPA_14456 [Diplonema papillatum]
MPRLDVDRGAGRGSSPHPRLRGPKAGGSGKGGAQPVHDEKRRGGASIAREAGGGSGGTPAPRPAAVRPAAGAQPAERGGREQHGPPPPPAVLTPKVPGSEAGGGGGVLQRKAGLQTPEAPRDGDAAAPTEASGGAAELAEVEEEVEGLESVLMALAPPAPLSTASEIDLSFCASSRGSNPGGDDDEESRRRSILARASAQIRALREDWRTTLQVVRSARTPSPTSHPKEQQGAAARPSSSRRSRTVPTILSQSGEAQKGMNRESREGGAPAVHSDRAVLEHRIGSESAREHAWRRAADGRGKDVAASLVFDETNSGLGPRGNDSAGSTDASSRPQLRSKLRKPRILFHEQQPSITDSNSNTELPGLAVPVRSPDTTGGTAAEEQSVSNSDYTTGLETDPPGLALPSREADPLTRRLPAHSRSAGHDSSAYSPASRSGVQQPPYAEISDDFGSEARPQSQGQTDTQSPPFLPRAESSAPVTPHRDRHHRVTFSDEKYPVYGSFANQQPPADTPRTPELQASREQVSVQAYTGTTASPMRVQPSGRTPARHQSSSSSVRQQHSSNMQPDRPETELHSTQYSTHVAPQELEESPWSRSHPQTVLQTRQDAPYQSASPPPAGLLSNRPAYAAAPRQDVYQPAATMPLEHVFSLPGEEAAEQLERQHAASPGRGAGGGSRAGSPIFEPSGPQVAGSHRHQAGGLESLLDASHGTTPHGSHRHQAGGLESLLDASYGTTPHGSHRHQAGVLKSLLDASHGTTPHGSHRHQAGGLESLLDASHGTTPHGSHRHQAGGLESLLDASYGTTPHGSHRHQAGGLESLLDASTPHGSHRHQAGGLESQLLGELDNEKHERSVLEAELRHLEAEVTALTQARRDADADLKQRLSAEIKHGDHLSALIEEKNREQLEAVRTEADKRESELRERLAWERDVFEKARLHSDTQAAVAQGMQRLERLVQSALGTAATPSGDHGQAAGPDGKPRLTPTGLSSPPTPLHQETQVGGTSVKIGERNTRSPARNEQVSGAAQSPVKDVEQHDSVPTHQGAAVSDGAMAVLLAQQERVWGAQLAAVSAMCREVVQSVGSQAELSNTSLAALCETIVASVQKQGSDGQKLWADMLLAREKARGPGAEAEMAWRVAEKAVENEAGKEMASGMASLARTIGTLTTGDKTQQLDTPPAAVEERPRLTESRIRDILRRELSAIFDPEPASAESSPGSDAERAAHGAASPGGEGARHRTPSPAFPAPRQQTPPPQAAARLSIERDAATPAETAPRALAKVPQKGGGSPQTPAGRRAHLQAAGQLQGQQARGKPAESPAQRRGSPRVSKSGRPASAASPGRSKPAAPTPGGRNSPAVRRRLAQAAADEAPASGRLEGQGSFKMPATASPSGESVNETLTADLSAALLTSRTWSAESPVLGRSVRDVERSHARQGSDVASQDGLRARLVALRKRVESNGVAAEDDDTRALLARLVNLEVINDRLVDSPSHADQETDRPLFPPSSPLQSEQDEPPLYTKLKGSSEPGKGVSLRQVVHDIVDEHRCHYSSSRPSSNPSERSLEDDERVIDEIVATDRTTTRLHAWGQRTTSSSSQPARHLAAEEAATRDRLSEAEWRARVAVLVGQLDAQRQVIDLHQKARLASLLLRHTPIFREERSRRVVLWGTAFAEAQFIALLALSRFETGARESVVAHWVRSQQSIGLLLVEGGCRLALRNREASRRKRLLSELHRRTAVPGTGGGNSPRGVAGGGVVRSGSAGGGRRPPRTRSPGAVSPAANSAGSAANRTQSPPVAAVAATPSPPRLRRPSRTPPPSPPVAFPHSTAVSTSTAAVQFHPTREHMGESAEGATLPRYPVGDVEACVPRRGKTERVGVERAGAVLADQTNRLVPFRPDPSDACMATAREPCALKKLRMPSRSPPPSPSQGTLFITQQRAASPILSPGGGPRANSSQPDSHRPPSASPGRHPTRTAPSPPGSVGAGAAAARSGYSPVSDTSPQAATRYLSRQSTGPGDQQDAPHSYSISADRASSEVLRQGRSPSLVRHVSIFDTDDDVGSRPFTVHSEGGGDGRRDQAFGFRDSVAAICGRSESVFDLSGPFEEEASRSPRTGLHNRTSGSEGTLSPVSSDSSLGEQARLRRGDERQAAAAFSSDEAEQPPSAGAGAAGKKTARARRSGLAPVRNSRTAFAPRDPNGMRAGARDLTRDAVASSDPMDNNGPQASEVLGLEGRSLVGDTRGYREPQIGPLSFYTSRPHGFEGHEAADRSSTPPSHLLRTAERGSALGLEGSSLVGNTGGGGYSEPQIDPLSFSASRRHGIEGHDAAHRSSTPPSHLLRVAEHGHADPPAPMPRSRSAPAAGAGRRRPDDDLIVTVARTPAAYPRFHRAESYRTGYLRKPQPERERLARAALRPLFEGESLEASMARERRSAAPPTELYRAQKLWATQREAEDDAERRNTWWSRLRGMRDPRPAAPGNPAAARGKPVRPDALSGAYPVAAEPDLASRLLQRLHDHTARRDPRPKPAGNRRNPHRRRVGFEAHGGHPGAAEAAPAQRAGGDGGSPGLADEGASAEVAEQSDSSGVSSGGAAGLSDGGAAFHGGNRRGAAKTRGKKKKKKRAAPAAAGGKNDGREPPTHRRQPSPGARPAHAPPWKGPSRGNSGGNNNGSGKASPRSWPAPVLAAVGAFVRAPEKSAMRALDPRAGMVAYRRAVEAMRETSMRADPVSCGDSDLFRSSKLYITPRRRPVRQTVSSLPVKECVERQDIVEVEERRRDNLWTAHGDAVTRLTIRQNSAAGSFLSSGASGAKSAPAWAPPPCHARSASSSSVNTSYNVNQSALTATTAASPRESFWLDRISQFLQPQPA